mgnify:CR=1 FL=1|tara:strand:- start:1296 stop:1490 length:195 start_codon:yes stop_codon:yes gene_type:complete
MSNQGIYLNDNQQSLLRSKGIILESEVALKKGDIIIAVSAVGNSERIVGYAKDILVENRKILKG